MSLTSSSDSDPELDYSDEEIRCSFTRSPTISDEDGEDTHILATSNFGLSYDERKELLNTNFTQQKRDLRLYPGNMHNWLKNNHPDIFQRLRHFLKDKNHFAFCAPSVFQSLNSRRAHILPKNMICDVCIFTEHQPTFVLTFRTREDIQDKVGGLNAELNRYIVAEIRRGTSTNFSSVYGVVNKHDCLSDHLFNAKIEAFINFVNTIAAPHSLRMNYATYRSSAHCFMKMVPEQTSDLTADYIEHGRELFIERNGFTQCKDRLKTHKSVVIVSPPGEGKTTLGLALLRYFRDVQQEDGAKYKPIILQTPEEWQKQIDKTSHQIILIDDMFGMYVLSQSKLCHWRDKMPDMIHSLVGGSKLLVMTLRNNIYRDLSATCTLKLFQPDNVIDLWFTRPLLYQDKDLLAQIYSQHHGANVSEDYIKAVATAESVQGFPLLCKTLMQSVAKGNGTSRDDMDCVHIQILSTEIQNLKDYDVSIFALLVIVALNGGSVNKENTPPCSRDVLQCLKCSHYEFKSLLCRCKAYFDIYLKENGETIAFSHPNVQQAVARVFSLSHPMIMIQNGSIKQLSDIFTVTTKDISKISPVWKISLVSVDEWKELGRRFVVLIQNGEVADVCGHESFNNKAFIETFFKLQSQRKMSKLLLTQDSQHGLPMLYWSVFTNNSFLTETIIDEMKISTKTRLEKIMSMFGKKINRAREIEMFESTAIASLLAGNIDSLKEVLNALPENSKQNLMKMNVKRNIFPTRNRQQTLQNIRGYQTLSDLAVDKGCIGALEVLRTLVEDDEDLQIGQYPRYVKKAILEGNQNNLRKLLETISKIGLEEILQSLTEAEDGSEHTFLCVAVQQGSIDMVRELVEFGDVHMTECCRPLLQTCLQHENLQIAQYLLENEYITSATDQSMLMPQLCEQNNTSAVELLLEHGCDVNTRSTAGFTLLQIACTKNYCELLRTLLRYNPDVVKADSDGNTVLHQSVNQRLKDIVATLAEYLQRNHQNLNCRNKEGNTALMMAIKGKDVETANILLEYNMAVNTVNNNGDTPLYYACNIPSMDIVTFLLRRDAHVNISNKQGVTPLHVASSNGDLKTIQHVDEHSTRQKTSRSHDTLCIRDEIVNVLLKKGANVNLQTVTGDTALHYACRHGRHSAVGALIKADARIEVKNKFGEVPLHLACMTPWSTEVSLLLTCSVVDMKTAAGNTPLHLACSSNNTNAVQTLLNMDADMNAQNNDHHTPLCIAFRGKSHEALEILLNKYRTTNLKHAMCSTNENRCAAAWLACSKAEHPTAIYSDLTLIKEPILEHLCRRNHLEDMERLLMQDVSLETINQCLYLACTLRHVSIIMALLEHNANPGWKTRKDNTSLHAAVASNSEETVNALLSAKNIKECINAKNETGDTALHIACRHTHTEILKTLLKSGADPNIRNTSDEAPLHVACKQKDAKTVEILLEKGFDANSLARGYSPLHTACKYSNLAVVRVLVEYKANVNVAASKTTPLHVAEKERKEDIVRYLIQNGANKFARDVDQRTPLAYRYYTNGHVHITPDVELLLNKGSDVNCALSDGNTALIHEVRQNHLDVVKELVRRGAIIDKHDIDERSPLLLACYLGFAEIVKYLVQSKATIDNPDEQCRTPLYMACNHGHAGIAKYLIDNGANPNFVSTHERRRTPMHIMKKSTNEEIKGLYKTIQHPNQN